MKDKFKTCLSPTTIRSLNSPELLQFISDNYSEQYLDESGSSQLAPVEIYLKQANARKVFRETVDQFLAKDRNELTSSELEQLTEEAIELKEFLVMDDIFNVLSLYPNSDELIDEFDLVKENYEKALMFAKKSLLSISDDKE